MILDEIVAKKKLQIEEESGIVPLSELVVKASQRPETKDFKSALKKEGLSVIAEVKHSSPSKGIIAQDFCPVEIAKEYENGGADALSVLTEKYYFKGDNDYLSQIRDNVKLPILRKDFIISSRQVVEARAIGADAILLIAAILDEKSMKEFSLLAKEYDMACLFEVHNSEEIKKVLDCGAEIIGINNRNLKTFDVDLGLFERLKNEVPRDIILVAESGIQSYTNALYMKHSGADAVLVGEFLMTAKDKAVVIKKLRGDIND